MAQNILLLGANGQLGKEWQHHMGEKNAESYTLSAYSSLELDITRFEEVEKEINRHRPDVIINCAAYTQVDKAESDRQKSEEINAASVKNMAELCVRYQVKLVHFSTDYIFAGSKQDRMHFPEGYPEGHPAEPVNWYGQTKWMGEQAIRSSGCRHLIVRLSWLCGAYGANFVTTMLRLAESHKKIQVVHDQSGSPSFTRNVVENTRKLIEQKREGTYHLSSSGLISWAEFAEAVFDFAGCDVKVEFIASDQYPSEAKRPHFSKLDTGKIQKMDGIQIEDWKAGLRYMLQNLSSGPLI